MCEFSERLIVWLDRELPHEDAAEIERHLQECAPCRVRAEAYRQASRAFDAYCDAYCSAALSAEPRRKLPRWAAAVSGVAAIAAAVAALLLLAPRARIRQLPARAPAPVAGAAIVSQPVHTAQAEPAMQLALSASAPVKHAPRVERRKGAGQIRHVVPNPRVEEDRNSLATAPAVEITIPADAIFPPGAVPAGVSFIADVTIAPDGSAQQIRLRPQLAEFGRRPTQP